MFRRRPKAGWYGDPMGSGQLRWWDGRNWTDRTTVTATVEAPSASGFTLDSDSSMWGVPGPPKGKPAKGPADALAGGTVARRSRVAGLRRLVIVPVVGLVLISVVLGALSLFFDEITEFIESLEDAAAAPDDTDIEVVVADEVLTTAQPVSGTIPAGGVWQATIETVGGRIVIDIRGLGGTDPVAELLDHGADLVTHNDDRSVADVEAWGGTFLDSLIDVELAPGTYLLHVTDYRGRGGSIEVEVRVLDGQPAV